MKLSDYLASLAGNKELTVTLIDNNEVELITFNVTGYASLESDITDRNVKRMNIVTSTEAKIVIEDATP